MVDFIEKDFLLYENGINIKNVSCKFAAIKKNLYFCR